MVSGEPFSEAVLATRGHLSRIMEALEKSPAVCYIVDSRYRITYWNPAWNGFARENGAPQLANEDFLGRVLFDFIPEVLKPAYSDAFQHVRTTGEVWQRRYECSSRNVFREFRMRIHGLRPQDSLVVTNTCVVERAHTRTAPADANTYVDRNGLITMCAHCRCSMRVESVHHWDFVPEYLSLTPRSSVRVSHGLCPVCRAYFYRVK